MNDPLTAPGSSLSVKILAVMPANHQDTFMLYVRAPLGTPCDESRSGRPVQICFRDWAVATAQVDLGWHI